MDMVEEAKRKANLKKFLKDFPWLWAILQKWHHWQVEINVCYASASDLGKLMDFSQEKILVWIKGMDNFMGKDIPAEEVVHLTPGGGECSLISLIYRYKNFHPFDVQYAILVVEGITKGIKTITIFRPPKPQKVW